MPADVAAAFAANWARWEAGGGDVGELEHVVDWAAGY